MKSDHGRWPFPMVRLDGPTSMVRFLKKSIHKAFGPLTRCKLNVDQEEWSCTKSGCVDLKNTYIRLKKVVKKNIKFDHSLVSSWASLVFTCLHFLLNVSKMWLANLLTTIFTKNKMSDLICTCDMYLVLYIEHYLQYASSCVLRFLSSRCPTLVGETRGSWF